MRIVTIIMAVIINLISINVSSQNLYFKHLGINDGLSQVCIPSIYQDESGVVWIGTSEGINRYNGVSMIKFQENKTVWSNRNITKITGHKNGFIYVISENSLNSIGLHTGETTCIREKGVYDIFFERDTLWCVCDEGIFYYTEKDKELKFFTKRPSRLYQFSRILVKGDKIYSATPASIFVIDKNNPEKHDKIADIGGNIMCLYVSKYNNIWVGTWKGVFKITPEKEVTNFNSTPMNGGISHNQVRCITEDNYGNIWLGTFLGLDCYNHITGIWKHYTKSGDSPNTLSHNSVLSLYTDNKGNIWVGTYFGGVNIFNPDPNANYFYHASPSDDGQLNFRVVSKMSKDGQGNIWVCTEGGGMNILNVSKGDFKHLMHKDDDPKTLGANNLKSIYYNPENRKMYIGTHWGGLYVYDTKSGIGHSIKNSKAANSLPNDIVNEIIPYKGGLILLTQGGVVYMDTQTEKVRKISVNSEVGKILDKKYAYETLTLDSRNRLWLGHTNGGVTCVNLNTSETEYFNLDSIKSSKVSHIYEDQRGEIYVCTLGSGLFHYINHKNVFTSSNFSNSGIPNDYCYYACSAQDPRYQIYKALFSLMDNMLTLYT